MASSSLLTGLKSTKRKVSNWIYKTCTDQTNISQIYTLYMYLMSRAAVILYGNVN